MVNKKLQVWLPLVFSIVLIAGMFFGYKLNDQTGGKKGFFSGNKTGTLQEVLDLIRMKYVDSVRIDSLQGRAIQEMMSELDPHSVYFPPVELKEVNEDLAGNFEGIGVEFNIFSDTVNVVYVMTDGPSDKAGLQIGDKIIKVDDFSLTGKSFSTDEIKKHIRGERNSKAELTILRGKELKKITVNRGTIPVSSVDAAYRINDTIGYIKINKFTQNTYEEFMPKVEELKKQGIRHLVLDLRGNGGGFMNEATEIADEFLSGNKLIVYTEGNKIPRREYRGKRDGIFEEGKIMVIQDELSASASEVLAGALQDWDRAVIIGRRSFGKGLVQEQYKLSDGGAIRLTVARYYTPLERSIQRPYDKGKKVYMDELWDRFSNGELLYADSNKFTNGKVFETKSGKKVYGGGGIMPDIFVPLDTSSFSRAINRLLVSGDVNNFVYNYYLHNRSLVDTYPTPAEFIKGFRNDNEMWEQFVKHSSNDSINLSRITGKEKEALQKRLKALLARFKWRNQGFFQVLYSDDAMIGKAVETISHR